MQNNTLETRVKQVYNAFNQQGGTIHQLINKVNNNPYLIANYKHLGYTNAMDYLLNLMDNKIADYYLQIARIKFGLLIKSA